MRAKVLILATCILLVAGSSAGTAPQAQQQAGDDDPVRTMVSRLTLDNYKTTLKGLTHFGDRRQGTQRNRDAVDWIEAQLKAVGCTTTARIDYVFDPEPRTRRRRPARELNPTESTPTTNLYAHINQRHDDECSSTDFGNVC